jgi:hypothetical protein
MLTGRASFQYNDLTGTLDFLCAVATNPTSSSMNGGDYAPISADCSGNIPKVGCTSCCQCIF